VPRLITNSPILRQEENTKRFLKQRHLGSISGVATRIFMKTGRVFVGLVAVVGNWAGRGKTQRRCPIRERRSENRSNALDRISLGGDLESACGRIVDCCFIGRSDWFAGVAFGPVSRFFAFNR